jgi:hypothetical protein
MSPHSLALLMADAGPTAQRQVGRLLRARVLGKRAERLARTAVGAFRTAVLVSR